MKEIQLTKGEVALVDDEDFKELIMFRWCKSGSGHAHRNLGNYVGNITMHRQIMKNIPEGYQVDHIDGNKLNNQRYNLRAVPRGYNSQNRKIDARNSTGYKGVGLSKGKWRARIRHNGIEYDLGRFDSIEEAARAYDTKAVELYGLNAATNFPQTVPKIEKTLF